jgi:hypothetical protein
MNKWIFLTAALSITFMGMLQIPLMIRNRELARQLTLERGDEVEIVKFSRTEMDNGLLNDCKVTYLDRVAVSTDNVVFLLLQNCSHPYFADKQVWYEVRPFSTIRKKYETK